MSAISGLEKRILIIDDEVDLGEILVDILSTRFDNVQYISDSEVGLKSIKEGDFNLILSDVNMPKYPGPELLKQVRAAGKLTPVIFVTAYADKEMVLKALRLGAADVIEKPFDQENLVKTIDRIFEIERRRQELFLNSLNLSPDPVLLEKQAKMLGLLLVTNHNKLA